MQAHIGCQYQSEYMNSHIIAQHGFCFYKWARTGIWTVQACKVENLHRMRALMLRVFSAFSINQLCQLFVWINAVINRDKTSHLLQIPDFPWFFTVCDNFHVILDFEICIHYSYM